MVAESEPEGAGEISMAIRIGKYQLELANKIRGGRAVGNEYVVTRRSIGLSTIIARFDTKAKAKRFMLESEKRDRKSNPSRRSIHTTKWDRCVKDVSARGGAKSAAAVCTATIDDDSGSS